MTKAYSTILLSFLICTVLFILLGVIFDIIVSPVKFRHCRFTKNWSPEGTWCTRRIHPFYWINTSPIKCRLCKHFEPDDKVAYFIDKGKRWHPFKFGGI